MRTFRARLCAILGFCLLLTGLTPSAAQALSVQSAAPVWPSPVTTFSDIIMPNVVRNACSDGAGGVIVVASVDGDIYAMRVAADGGKLWGAAPTLVCGGWGTQAGDYLGEALACCSDGSGGAIVVWQDHASDGYFAQRLDASGSRCWPVDTSGYFYDGVPVGPGPYYTFAKPRMVPDGSGGAFIAWQCSSYTDPNAREVRVQHFSTSGIAIWTDGGVVAGPLLAGSDYTSNSLSSVCADGTGGACVAYSRWTPADGDYCFRALVSRVAADGSVPAALADVAAGVTSVYYQMDPSLVADGDGNVIVAWQDGRPAEGTTYTDDTDIYAQKIDLVTGAREWDDAGELLCGAPGRQQRVLLFPGAEHAAVAVWEDCLAAYPSHPWLRANAIDAAGSPAWRPASDPGVDVQSVDGSMYQNMWSACSDGAGGVLVAWTSMRNTSGERPGHFVYAQHLSAGGGTLWRDGHGGEGIDTQAIAARPLVLQCPDEKPAFVWAQTPCGSSASFSVKVAKLAESADAPVPVVDTLTDPRWTGSISITGRRFGEHDPGSSVSLETPAGTVEADIVGWHDTWIEAAVPSGVTLVRSARVITAYGTSNVTVFPWPPIAITSVDPRQARAGQAVTITGSGFGYGGGTVTFGGAWASCDAWSDTSITARVPAEAWGCCRLRVTSSYTTSARVTFYVTPWVKSLSTTLVHPGSLLTIRGTGFGPTKATGAVVLGAQRATPVSWSNTRIVVQVPLGVAGVVPVLVGTGGGGSNPAYVRVQ